MSHQERETPSTFFQLAGRRCIPRFFSFRSSVDKKATWQSNALRPTVLLGTAIVCWTLIAGLQILLNRSNRDGGIIFADNVNGLPLRTTFSYRYLPTIIAVLYSILWNWIDLETKRLEPYHQLSKKTGASGRDSLLLHYPFDFLPLVPITAFKKRHWTVFCAAVAVVLVSWGVVPTQAGIFTTRKVTRVFSTPFDISTSLLPTEQQELKINLNYARSAYGIVALDEPIPPFMSRNYTLAPFKSTSPSARSNGTWTATTTMFSLDLTCEQSFLNQSVYYAKNGCYSVPYQGFDNLTIGPTDFRSQDGGPFYATKEFSGVYVGYWNDIGTAMYDLSSTCPVAANHTFFAAFTRNKAKATDSATNATAIFCEPAYYSQEVNATIDAITKAPRSVIPLSPKVALSNETFNARMFEYILNLGDAKHIVRDEFPQYRLPDYLDRLPDDLTLSNGAIDTLNFISALGIATTNKSLATFLDADVLAASYENAYRLLFALFMAEVIDQDFSTTKEVLGQSQLLSEAVVLEPVFTYIVEGLLGTISLLALSILFLSIRRPRILGSNPSTLASVMTIVAENEALLADFSTLDILSTEGIERRLSDKVFKLEGGDRAIITEIGQDPHPRVLTSPASSRDSSGYVDIAKPTRPFEFTWFIGSFFVGVQAFLAIGLGVLFINSQANGLALPSKSPFVQNLLENYLPTAIATLIEPMWILINRLLCMLQPLEELRGCNATAKKSIDLDYSSLPPQLVVFKAFKSRHFVLAAVCTMAVLANILAIAFSGLFYHDTRYFANHSVLRAPFEPKFVTINGSVGPHVPAQSIGVQTFDPIYGMNASGAYRGGEGEDQFIVAESNYTKGTPFPAWTDGKRFYLPFLGSTSENMSSGVHYEASTATFGARLQCAPLVLGANYSMSMSTIGAGQATVQINSSATFDSGSGSASVCRSPPFEKTYTCHNGTYSAELVFFMEARPNATKTEISNCAGWVILGWMRSLDGNCDKSLRLNAKNSMFMTCRPIVEVGEATVTVDSVGQLLQPARQFTAAQNASAQSIQQYFSNDPANLIQQSNKFLFEPANTNLNSLWHNDSLPMDFMNYFLTRAANTSRFVNPNESLPAFQDVERPLGEAYARLFAVWLGAYKDRLFIKSQADSANVSALSIQPHERLFLSTPMFAIAEGILCTYVVVGILVYLRRPGQYLPRMPISIASIIALFAASAAVRDLGGTSNMNKKQRASYLEKLDQRYGYGSYVGGDGRVHIGIEKVPFVRRKRLETWLERRVRTFTK